MRRQLACRLTMRLSWEVVGSQTHPSYSFTCAEDRDMAITIAWHVANGAKPGFRLVAAEVSPTGGRAGDWDLLELNPTAAFTQLADSMEPDDGDVRGQVAEAAGRSPGWSAAPRTVCLVRSEGTP